MVTRANPSTRDRSQVRHDAEVAGDRPTATGRPPRPWRAALNASAMLLAITGAVLLVVAVVIGLATESWVALVAALLVHAILTAAVITFFFKKLSVEGDKPSATEVAALEEREGYTDAEQQLAERGEGTFGEGWDPTRSGGRSSG